MTALRLFILVSSVCGFLFHLGRLLTDLHYDRAWRRILGRKP